MIKVLNKNISEEDGGGFGGDMGGSFDGAGFGPDGGMVGPEFDHENDSVVKDHYGMGPEHFHGGPDRWGFPFGMRYWGFPYYGTKKKKKRRKKKSSK